MPLSENHSDRKAQPMALGLLDYFPDALAAVSHVSVVGAEQHNAYKPNGEIMWRKDLSTDHADCIIRHLADRGTNDKDGLAHSAKVAWRALAMLQIEIEQKRQRDEAQIDEALGKKLSDIDYAAEMDKLDAMKSTHPLHVGYDIGKPGGDKTAIWVFGDRGLDLDYLAKLLGVDSSQIVDARHPAAPAEPQAPIPGLLNDFAAWLTTRPNCVHVGAQHTVYQMFDALQEYANLLVERELKG